MTDTEREKRISTAISRLLLKQGFYAAILLQLKRVAVKDGRYMPFPTMGTDGRRLFYHPDYVDSLNDEELEGVLCHEAVHIAGLHPLRREGRHPMGWNIAADMEVNEIVQNQGGMILPKDTIPGKPGTAEQHYEDMRKKHEKLCGCGSGQGDESEDCDQHSGQRSCVIFEPECEPGEDPANVRAEIEETVKQAWTVAKMAGNVPEGMDRLLEDLLVPKLKWYEILRRFVETKYEPQIQWDSPNRRHLHRGIVLPGLGRKQTFAEIGFGIDTSGSMGGEELLAAASEVRYVIDDVYGNDVLLPVIWFDAAAYLDFVGMDDDLVPKGGGGTDFSVVMECVKENDLKISGLVIVTDGYCGSFGEEPECPVLWVVFGDYADAFEPPFGDVVKLPLD